MLNTVPSLCGSRLNSVRINTRLTFVVWRPPHQYCAYTWMDIDSDVIVHCEIVDKREVQLKFPNTE